MGIRTPDQPERDTVKHPGVENAAPRLPPKRTATMPNMAALKAPPLFSQPEPELPGSAPLPREHAATVPASAHTARTQRAGTPVSGQAVRIENAPQSALGSLPPPSQSPDVASLEAVRRRAEAAEAKVAELERDARAAAEARQQTYPPKVEQRRPSPPAGTRVESASTPPDAAIGKSVRFLLGKLWPFFVAAAGIGGGVTAVAKPSVDPAKTDATLANTEAMKRDLALVRTQLNGALDREATRDAFVLCLYEQQGDYFGQLLPSQEKLVTAQPLRVWVDRCKTRKP